MEYSFQAMTLELTTALCTGSVNKINQHCKRQHKLHSESYKKGIVIKGICWECLGVGGGQLGVCMTKIHCLHVGNLRVKVYSISEEESEK